MLKKWWYLIINDPLKVEKSDEYTVLSWDLIENLKKDWFRDFSELNLWNITNISKLNYTTQFFYF